MGTIGGIDSPILLSVAVAIFGRLMPTGLGVDQVEPVDYHSATLRPSRVAAHACPSSGKKPRGFAAAGPQMSNEVLMMSADRSG